MKAFEALVDEFIRCIRERRTVDYGSRISVAKYNALAKRSTKIAQVIDARYHARIDDFLALMDCDEWDVRVACAVCAIQNFSCAKEQRQAAVNLIKRYVSEAADPIEASAFTVNLEKWEADEVTGRNV